jgi:hypothetical protein
MEHEAIDAGALAWGLGWILALLVLFRVALRLPLETRFGRVLNAACAAGAILAGLAVTLLANIALHLHDAHVDLTREKTYTPSAAALRAVAEIDRPVSITYFYRSQDPEARRARDLLLVMAHVNPLLKIAAIDPDRDPTLARRQGIDLYNAAVIEASGEGPTGAPRRVLVQTTDETEIAIGMQRVLRGEAITLCFLEGHGELPMDNFEYHTHLESVGGHSHGSAASQVVEMPGHGVGRLRRALEAQGYAARKLVLATAGAVPQECALVIDASPRTTFLPGESAALRRYLQQGGSVLLMLDLGFVLEPELARLVADLGLRAEQQAVVDPLSHYSTDPEMVAVTGYDPHPVTRGLSLTFYPGIRPFTLLQPAGDLRAIPLLQSSRDSYTRTVAPVETRAVEPLGGTGGGTAGDSETAAVPVAGPRVLGAAIEGSLPGGTAALRAIVIGDGDFASNSFLPFMANGDLLLSAVRWLAHEERTTTIATRIPVPPLVALTAAQWRTVFLITVVGLPLAVVVLGSVVWWRRR